MKRIPICIIILTTLLSCQREDNSSPTPTTCTEPSASLKYKFDGVLLEMSGSLSQNSREGVLFRKEQRNVSSPSTVLTNSSYCFSLLATKNYFFSDDGEPIIEIEINTPTLAVTTYPFSAIDLVATYYPLQASYCGTPCTPQAGTNFTFTISKILNGYADGSFSGTIKNGANTAFHQITDGEFRNVKILQ